MLRINPEGIVVLAYECKKDILMISQCYEWGSVAFIIIWLVLHYSLFPPSALSDLLDNCCAGYSTAVTDIPLGDIWYLESKDVFHPEELIDHYTHAITCDENQ